MSQLNLRPNVCMLVVNKEGRLFLGERRGEKGIWQFPQGGADEQFTPEHNVLRELSEELGAGIEKFRIMKQLASTHSYRFEKPRCYNGKKWEGQEQTFWLVEFLGEDTDINLFKNDAELMNWRWCTPDEVRALAEPKRLSGYQGPLAEFEQTIKRPAAF